MVTAVDRLVWWPWLVLWRFAGELWSRKGRRRLRRRAGWRLLVVFGVGVWFFPFALAFVVHDLEQFARGRVRVGAGTDPVAGVAVVLVPLPANPAAGGLAEPRAASASASAMSPDRSDVWMWADVDGWFSAMYGSGGVFPGVYRVEVRRPGCRVERLGVRRLWSVMPWTRRLMLEVGPCRTE